MPKKTCIKQPVYTQPQQPRGFTWETWAPGAGGSNSAIAGFEQAWSGPPLNGVPTHANGAPTTSGIETDVRFAQSERGQDEHKLCFWIWNDSSAAIELSDSDMRAESVRVYAGCDCSYRLVHERYQSGGGPYNSQGSFLTLPAGAITKLTVLIHDPGADFSGFWLRANTVGSETLFDPVTFQEKPTVECEIKCACKLAENQTLKPITLQCFDCSSVNAAVAIPDQEICTDIRTPYVSNRTSWWGGWTAVATANVAREIVVPWRQIATRTNTTGKTVDIRVEVDWGDHLTYLRRARMYLWTEWRVLINGTVVMTRTYDDYLYIDKRNDTNPDVVRPQLYEIQPMGVSMYHRYNAPVAAVISVEVQSRWQVAAAQTSAYARYIGGLRSQASIDLFLQNLVVGRI